MRRFSRLAHAVGSPAQRVTAPHRVGVIGLGLMGHGIAQATAEKGFDVVAVELETKFLDAGMMRIEHSVRKMNNKAVKQGKLSEKEGAANIAATLNRINPTTSLDELASCDLLIEAVVEDLALKESLYARIGALVSDECVIASNTSSLPISKMATFSNRPRQMCGLHFFNPVQRMQLVEVVRTDQTDESIFRKANFLRTLSLYIFPHMSYPILPLYITDQTDESISRKANHSLTHPFFPCVTLHFP